MIDFIDDDTLKFWLFREDQLTAVTFSHQDSADGEVAAGNKNGWAMKIVYPNGGSVNGKFPGW